MAHHKGRGGAPCSCRMLRFKSNRNISGREKHQSAASCTCLDWDRTCHPGMCPERELNSDLLLCGMMPNQQSHTSQGCAAFLNVASDGVTCGVTKTPRCKRAHSPHLSGGGRDGMKNMVVGGILMASIRNQPAICNAKLTGPHLRSRNE